MAKLNDDLKNKILADWKAGISQNQLAKRYDVSPATINKLCKGIEQSNIEQSNSFKRSSYVDTEDGYVYIIFIEDSSGERFYKIGLARNVEARCKQHQTSTPFDIKVAISFYVLNMAKKEKQLHDMFSNKKIRGEWYKLSVDDLEAIKNQVEIYG